MNEFSQFEYDVVSMQSVQATFAKEMLNKQGLAGWELIAISGGPTVFYYFFKRKITTLHN